MVFTMSMHYEKPLSESGPDIIGRLRIYVRKVGNWTDIETWSLKDWISVFYSYSFGVYGHQVKNAKSDGAI